MLSFPNQHRLKTLFLHLTRNHNIVVSHFHFTLDLANITSVPLPDDTLIMMDDHVTDQDKPAVPIIQHEGRQRRIEYMNWLDFGFLMVLFVGAITLRSDDLKESVCNNNWAGNLAFACLPVTLSYAISLAINHLPITPNANSRIDDPIRRVLCGCVSLFSVWLFRYTLGVFCTSIPTPSVPKPSML